MFSKEFMKFLISDQMQETSKKNEYENPKETKDCTRKLATILLTSTK